MYGIKKESDKGFLRMGGYKMSIKSKRKFRLMIMCFILCISILLIIYSLSKKGIYLQIGTPPGGIRSYQINCLLIVLLLISGVYLLHYTFYKLVITVISTIVACFIFSALLIIYFLHLADVDYTTFSSPDNKEHFVVVERYYGEIFQLSDNRIFMTYLGTTESDGNKPFLQGAYHLNWKSSDELIIDYSVTPPSNFSSKQITVKYKPSN